MTTFILLKYLHFVGIFGVVGALFAELFMVKKVLSRSEVRTIALVDGLYGAGALLTLAAGLFLWFAVGKPAAFYTGNLVFLAKVALFLVVGLLSITPTVYFLKNRKGDPEELITVPSAIRAIIRVEAAILLVIPLLAALMANGIGPKW